MPALSARAADMLVVLSGNDDFSKREYRHQLAADWGVEPVVVDLAKVDLAAAKMQLGAQDLFSSRQVVVLEQALTRAEVRDWLFEATEELASDQSLAVIVNEDKLDRRSKIAKLWVKQGLVKEFNQSRAAAERFLTERAKASKIDLDYKVRQLIVEQIGIDLFALDGAWRQLVALDRPLSVELVKEYLPANQEARVFDLAVQLRQQDRAGLEQNWQAIQVASDSPLPFVGLLASQFLNAYYIHISGNFSAAVRNFKINPHYAEGLQPLARSLSATEFKQALELISQLDLELKTASLADKGWSQTRLLVERLWQIFAREVQAVN